jgi:hypothetical protein
LLITNPDWSQVDDVTLWHSAKGGADGAAEELTRREARDQKDKSDLRELVTDIKRRRA